MLHGGGSSLPQVIVEGSNNSDLKSKKFSLASPISNKKQFHKRMISASREVTGKQSAGAKYARVRYNGNAFGGFNMTDQYYPRKSNLETRKMRVLTIAAENYSMVQRLQRVQSSVGRYSNTPQSSRERKRLRARPRSSTHLALSYPNCLDPRNLHGPHMPRRNARQNSLAKSKTVAQLTPLDPQAATSEALNDMMQKTR